MNRSNSGTPWVLLAVTLIAAGCASGGPALEGAGAEGLFAAYSGSWQLDVQESDPMPNPGSREPGQLAGRGDEAGQPPGGGRGGGRGGRGGRGGGARGAGAGGGQTAGGRNPQAMQRTMQLARQPWPRITVALNRETFSVNVGRRGRGVAVPMDGEWVDVDDGPGAPYRARLRWSGDSPRLERAVESGGRVEDRFELLGDGRMVITRRLGGGGPGGDLEVRLVYERVTGG